MTMDKTEMMALADEIDQLETDAGGKCNWADVATIGSALRRLAAGAGAGAVKVKPLEWREDDWHWRRADTPFGQVIIQQSKATQHPGWWFWWSHDDPINLLPTLDAAKAAAQADYEARILSALIPEPAKAGDAVLKSTIPTCCVTGAIPGDGGACGDCDPCLFGEASVPDAVKRLIAEKNSLLHRIGELEAGDAVLLREALEKIAGHRDYDKEDYSNAAQYKPDEGVWSVDEYLADAALSTAQPDTAAQGGKQSDGDVDYDTNDPMGVERSWPTSADIDDGTYTGDPRLATPLPSEPAPAEPVPDAWVIPGDNTANDKGFIDAIAWEEGEFTKPLYAHPIAPAAPVSVDEVARFIKENAYPTFDDWEDDFARALRDAFKMEWK